MDAMTTFTAMADRMATNTEETGVSAITTWVAPQAVAACKAALNGIGGPTLSDVGVVSCLRGEGRTTVAVAAALVQRIAYGRSTVLVELDLENPSITQRLRLAEGPGVGEVLRGHLALEDALRWVDPLMAVLTAGTVAADSSELLGRPGSAQMLDGLRERFDVAVVDLPPLAPAGAGTGLARYCHNVLLVVRAGVAPVEDVGRACSLLERPPWVLLNETRSRVPRWPHRGRRH